MGYFLVMDKVFYIRPTKTNTDYITSTNIEVITIADGQLEVVIIYSYKVRQGSGYQQEVINQSISGPDMLGAGGSEGI